MWRTWLLSENTHLLDQTRWRYGIVLGLLAALAWGPYLALTRRGLSEGLNIQDFLFIRFVTAGTVLAPWFFLFCRKQILETGCTKVFGLAFLAGPLMVMLVVGGNTFASAASGIPVELTTFSISCLVLSSWLLRYRLTKLQLVGMTALFLRIILISVPVISYYQTGASLGLLMSAAAGMMFAAFTVLVQRWRIEPFLAVTIVSVTGLCVYCPYYLLTQSADRLSQASSLLLFEQVLGQGLLAGIGAPTAFLVSARLLGLDRAVLLSALTPAIAVICSAALNREVPTFGQAAILVVGAAGALLLAVGKTAATR